APRQAEPQAQAQAPAAAVKKESQSLRVDAAKLDILVDLVGELVIAQSRLSQLAAGISHPGLVAVAEEIERLSNDLRDNTLNIRMLPIGTTFSKFRRLVRDLSAEMSKEIDLITEGAETELDKTVIEQLGDPLVHLLRNSIDHGVEPPEERTAKGKPAKGTIVLSAEHAGGEVLIRITDDGRGIDTGRVREKALERGLLAPDARPSEQELFMLIFAPGFSTAQKITNVSGRGVGMDVVKRSIEQLRGKIEIQSAAGKGTTITIRLPLTLAIIDGLMIKAGEEHYIIPLALVEECVEFSQDMQSDRKRTINLRGEIVPYVRLREAFEIGGDSPPIEQIVITHGGDERTGVAVDEVVGQLQTVIKSLGKVAGNVPGIAGATIRADGSLALIIDVPGLIHSIEHEAGVQ
ncbi:MAG: chemotaxis protein CheA, partial [Desulfovibrionaceae bacterium]|nr:chemotaxis protein CheA [Desulfovibrionaceae bacterium]